MDGTSPPDQRMPRELRPFDSAWGRGCVNGVGDMTFALSGRGKSFATMEPVRRVGYMHLGVTPWPRRVIVCSQPTYRHR